MKIINFIEILYLVVPMAMSSMVRIDDAEIPNKIDINNEVLTSGIIDLDLENGIDMKKRQFNDGWITGNDNNSGNWNVDNGNNNNNNDFNNNNNGGVDDNNGNNNGSFNNDNNNGNAVNTTSTKKNKKTKTTKTEENVTQTIQEGAITQIVSEPTQTSIIQAQPSNTNANTNTDANPISVPVTSSAQNLYPTATSTSTINGIIMEENNNTKVDYFSTQFIVMYCVLGGIAAIILLLTLSALFKSIKRKHSKEDFNAAFNNKIPSYHEGMYYGGQNNYLSQPRPTYDTAARQVYNQYELEYGNGGSTYQQNYDYGYQQNYNTQGYQNYGTQTRNQTYQGYQQGYQGY